MMKLKDKIQIGDAVTTLMYSSAVNVVLASSVYSVQSNIFIAIGMILFIFLTGLAASGFHGHSQKKTKT